MAHVQVNYYSLSTNYGKLLMVCKPVDGHFLGRLVNIENEYFCVYSLLPRVIWTR